MLIKLTTPEGKTLLAQTRQLRSVQPHDGTYGGSVLHYKGQEVLYCRETPEQVWEILQQQRRRRGSV